MALGVERANIVTNSPQRTRIVALIARRKNWHDVVFPELLQNLVNTSGNGGRSWPVQGHADIRDLVGVPLLERNGLVQTGQHLWPGAALAQQVSTQCADD